MPNNRTRTIVPRIILLYSTSKVHCRHFHLPSTGWDKKKKPKKNEWLDSTGSTWTNSKLLAKLHINKLALESPTWAKVKESMKFLPSKDFYELLVAWEAQQKWCPDLIEAIENGKIPKKYRTLVQQNNLQLKRLDKF